MAKISRDAFAPNPLDAKPTGATLPIDWSQPLELSDGTPVELMPPHAVPSMYGACNPDNENEYWVWHEEPAFRAVITKRWAFTADGLREKYHEAPLCVRNRRV